MSGAMGGGKPEGPASSAFNQGSGGSTPTKDKSDAMGLSAGQTKALGTGVAGGGLAIDVMGILNQSSANRDTIRANAKTEQSALKRDQRAEFGSMLASTGGSGIGLNSFADIFSNQTIEDARQMTQLKQQKEDAISADKNAKRGAILGSAVKAGKQAATLGFGL